VNARLLLDENISPGIAQVLQQEGIDVCGLRDRGLLGKHDSVILEWAFADDRMVVTKNVKDYEALASERELHAGLVLLEDGTLDADAQLLTIQRVLRLLEKERDLINRAVRVGRNGTITLKELSGATP
jgi:predicted nuclease of predicted toxin-antitoxin system